MDMAVCGKRPKCDDIHGSRLPILIDYPKEIRYTKSVSGNVNDNVICSSTSWNNLHL